MQDRVSGLQPNLLSPSLLAIMAYNICENKHYCFSYDIRTAAAAAAVVLVA